MRKQKVFVLTDGDTLTMPDMTGWTQKDINNYIILTGYNIKMNGSGVVISQSITPGQKIDQTMLIDVILE